MVIPVGAPARLPVLIVRLEGGEGEPGLELTSWISYNGQPFVEGPALTETGHGWYHVSIAPETTGYMIVEVMGGEGLSTWRDIVDVWEVEPTLPIRTRSIRAGVST